MTRKLIFVIALLLLVGCQKGPGVNRPNDGSIVFRFKTEDVQIEKSNSQTKGTPQNSLEKYDSVSVSVYSHTSGYAATINNDVKFLRKVKLGQDAEDWNYTPSMYWPAGKQLSFLAYASDISFTEAGITFVPSAAAPDSIRYKVPTDVTKQPDLLVSTKFDQLKADDISLTMKHALSCVSFVGVAPKEGVFVRKIILRNVYGSGALRLDDPSMKWEVDESSKKITILEAGIKDDEELGKNPPANKNYLMTADGYLMMIPQQLKDAVIDVFYWNGTDQKDDKIMTYTLPIDEPSYATWKPGEKYIYKFGSQSEDDITVYYEKYADGYGLYYSSNNSSLNTDGTKKIEEAGYGVVSKKSIGNVASIRLNTPFSTPVSSGTVVKLGDDLFLYPVSQTGGGTFALSASTTPENVYFNGSNQSCGLIVPHFAKGIYKVQTAIKTHTIRTPQQMRNITSSDASSARKTHTYTQELDLDFSKESIGGGNLTTAVVNREFNDLFNGQSKRIENVNINASMTGHGALFQKNSGEINEVVLVNSSIISSGNTGGITAVNQLNGEIINPRIIGENSANPLRIEATSGPVGAIVGCNYGKITGNTDLEVATELPVAEVSGWISITTTTDAGTGGIVGENQGTIATCLVYGARVTGPNLGDVDVAKITITGGKYTGGIAGVNRSIIEGNYSYAGVGNTMQGEPDLAGIVTITGSDFVGGIAGENSGTLNRVNVRLGRGDANNAMTIRGNESVGGIVGYNRGTLQVDAKSFISVRGNVRISGIKNVGGIVGNNQGGDLSNCFVYNFYSQSRTNQLVHYAPKITGETNVGGIAGYAGSGIIKQSSVFSTVSAANVGTGDKTNAMVEIKATVSSAGGIVGSGFKGLTITASSLLGNVNVSAAKNSGGIMGENETETIITDIHVGNSGKEVSDIYEKLFKVINLPVYDSRMQTGGNAMTKTSGTPTMEGTIYVGGVCGVNWGTVDGVSIKDNVKIGTPSTNFVGGITGGIGTNSTVKNCRVYNPKDGDATVTIIGAIQVGGIVGLNNGIVTRSQLGLELSGSSRLIEIKGSSAVGGIAGTNGGYQGDSNTRVEFCNVYGKVKITASGDRAGGIVGENGPNNNRVISCNVIGYASTYTGMDVFDYDVTVSGSNHVGGLAGANYGHIYGDATFNSKVTHTAVVSGEQGGGLVGTLKSSLTDVATLYYCDVSQGVLIYKWETGTGAFAGEIEGENKTDADVTLFGTASGGPTNKIYRGTINPVRVSANTTVVTLPPSMGSLPETPNPPITGNLWAKYRLRNYLYWTEYR